MCWGKRSANTDSAPGRLTVRERVRRLLALNNTPHEISLGVALGVFIAIMPLYGLHTVMVILAALMIKRVNKIAILLGTNINTTLTFPFITWLGYTLGRHVLGNAYPPLRWDIFKHFSYHTIMQCYVPLFVGSLILAIVTAAGFYYLVFWCIAMRAARRNKG